MRKLLLTKRELFAFLAISMTITAPCFLLSIFGMIKNEDALILFLPFLAGLPWNLIYGYLPVDIPGITSAGLPDASGNLTVSVFELMFFMIPVYINIYLFVRLLGGLSDYWQARNQRKPGNQN